MPEQEAEVVRGTRDEVAELRLEVSELRGRGLSQREIAEKVGKSVQRVRQLLNEAQPPRSLRKYDEYLADAVERCEGFLDRLEPNIQAGDPRSIDSATRVVDRLSRLLGLDHRDRMSERTVRVEEAKVQLVGQAVAAMLDHLGIVGDRRLEAVQVLQGELERAEASL